MAKQTKFFLAGFIGGGCNLNRNIPKIIKKGGFKVKSSSEQGSIFQNPQL